MPKIEPDPRTLPSRQGLGILFPDGYEPVQFKTDGDSQDVDPFNRIICGLYAGCFAMPLGRALGQYTSNSYAGVRGELLPYHKALQADRLQLWEPLWLDPLYEDSLAECVLMPPFQRFLAELTEEERRGLDLSNRRWQWSAEDLVVDPSRERTAQKLRLGMGLATREEELDSPDIDQHDARAAKQLGIVREDGEPDIMRYRRIVAQTIHGVALEPSGGGDPLGSASDEEEPEPAGQAARLEANCGTGKGGFQSGNTCGKRGGGDSAVGIEALAQSTAQRLLSRAGRQSTAEVSIVGDRKTVLDRFAEVAGTRRQGALASLAGAPDDAQVRLAVSSSGHPQITISHPTFAVPAIRLLEIDPRGRKFIHNAQMELKPEAQGTHLGAAMLARQAAQGEKRGFGHLQCFAAAGGYNGYYTWPRLGFNQKVADFNPDVSKKIRQEFPAARSVLDIFQTRKGRQWWKENEIEMDRAKFVLKAGSRSQRTLQTYLAALKS